MVPIKVFNRMIVHHSASRLETTLKDIRSWHVDSNGWSDIGYHFVVLSNGGVEQGRPLPIRGAHAKGNNSDSFGVCLVGNNLDPNNKWTEDQINSLHRVWNAAQILFPGIEIFGHRDVQNTTECPGVDVYKLIYGHERPNG